MNLLKTLILILILLTTYIVENDFRTENLGEPTSKADDFRSAYVDKTVIIGDFLFGFNELEDLIFISTNGSSYEVTLSSSIFKNNSFKVDSDKLVAKKDNQRLEIKINNKQIEISSSNAFNFTLFEKNINQKVPFFSMEREKAIRFELENKDKLSKNIILERKENSNIILVDFHNAIEIEYELTPRHHIVKTSAVDYVSLIIEDTHTNQMFKNAKENNAFFIFRGVTYFLETVASFLGSKLSAVFSLLILISTLTLPLEIFILSQNNKLQALKPVIDSLQKELVSHTERTLRIQALYRKNGIKALQTTFAFSLRVFLIVFCIYALLHTSAIDGMTFTFIDDFNAAGKGWLLVWILPLLYILEAKIKCPTAFRVTINKQFVLLSIYILLSVFLFTPLIVLVIIYFTVVRLVALIIERIKFISKEKVYVANFS